MTLVANKILHFSDKEIQFTAPYEGMVLKFSFLDKERQTYLYCDEDFITTLSCGYTSPQPEEKYLHTATEDLKHYLGDGDISSILQMLKDALDLFYNGSFDDMRDIALKIGVQQAKWAKKVVNNKIRQANSKRQTIYCADNFRWCRQGQIDEELRYKGIANKGCCGFLDWEETDSAGQIWKFGFNYGH